MTETGTTGETVGCETSLLIINMQFVMAVWGKLYSFGDTGV